MKSTFIYIKMDISPFKIWCTSFPYFGLWMKCFNLTPYLKSNSFCLNTIRCYIGNFDIPMALQEELDSLLKKLRYDDYDHLIQLCDCLAGAEGIMDMEARMLDVKRRYGHYPQEKWDRNMELRMMFETRCGADIYDIVK